VFQGILEVQDLRAIEEAQGYRDQWDRLEVLVLLDRRVSSEVLDQVDRRAHREPLDLQDLPAQLDKMVPVEPQDQQDQMVT